MNIDQAIDILTEHNKWRRGEPPYDSVTPQFTEATTKELGEAIDCAVHLLRCVEFDTTLQNAVLEEGGRLLNYPYGKTYDAWAAWNAIKEELYRIRGLEK